MTKIGFIRHGSTPWNIEGKAQGWCDIPLNIDGIVDANRLAQRLLLEDWDIIYSSDLIRAHHTANIIAEKMMKTVYLDSRLREIAGGLIEGTTEEERILKWGSGWRELDLQIESDDRVLSRGITFINEICEKHPNENVLIVSHGSFLKKIIKKLIPNEPFEESLLNTSITLLQRDTIGWSCSLFNCTKHLVLTNKEFT
ncbi:histidine phosphatase family protein [Metabacillus halosaccharovorans]|uniref:histidine phosphatase family protein n=1 Tax=Metabacillus halosaccharovorans TaxID=930124 RepID=UPI002042129C|nr:histidine phosphatase family protein [Metabacillus halosaccharovorans]MCM3439536.1 histidine phosphatase family protein [Metabacillus halosaccharovorans]